MVVLLLQKIKTLALEDWEGAALPNEDDETKVAQAPTR